jgi:CDGSH-type Zn-finger protein
MLLRGVRTLGKRQPLARYVSATAAKRAADAAPEAAPLADAEEAEDFDQKRLGSLWTNVWFPYEPIPVSCQLKPYIVNVKGGHGETYHFCTCGEAMTQPWADGTCKCSTGKDGWASILYQPRRDGYKLLCGCKMCLNKPKYDGTCSVVWMDYNPGKGCGILFASGFLISTFFSYILHP